MPKKADEISLTRLKSEVAKARKRGWGLIAVGGVAGLLLQVRGNATSWILRATIAGKRRDIGLGGYPDVPLTEARDRARAERSRIAAGVDPLEHRRALRAQLGRSVLTFDECARRLIESKRVEWKNAKHRDQWENTLDTYASPKIGNRPVDTITMAHVEDVLRPIWTTKTETAKRVRMRIEAVLGWATASGLRHGDNPARWRHGLDKLLPAPGKVRKVKNYPALAMSDMPRFMEALRKREGAAKALEFAILTATRSGEVRGARWPEIDLQAKLWTIPAERMKAGREHVVPLSAPAVALLKALPRFTNTDLVFPAMRGRMLSDMTLSKVMKLMHEADQAAKGPGFLDPRQKRQAVPHGFRSTFRDWAAEKTNYPRDVAEMALAHTIGEKVEAAYRRGELLAKRTRMMADWAKFIETKPVSGSVTPLRRMA